MMDSQVLTKMTRGGNIAPVIVKRMQELLPRSRVTEDVAYNIYKTCVSMNQQSRSNKGKLLEQCIEDVLKARQIPYLPQVTVDTTGIIHKSRGQKKGVHVHDFVIDAQVGDSIRDKIVLSCKTSLRERWRQDANVQCAKMYMITMEMCSKHVMASLKENKIALVIVRESRDGVMNLEECIEEIERSLKE